ncbi:MAG: ATP-binding protein [Bacteroidia bacterium]|nr:ATP-binding protein [Bacteroidia bacterium]
MKEISKGLILLRGLPGSGKTTLAKLLSEDGKYPVFSIDSYFTDPETGVYDFKFEENHIAYKKCEENTEKALKDGLNKVFVDNTFTIEWEMEPYFVLAQKYGYPIFVLTIENRHGNNNVHGISNEQLTKMASKYKVKLLPEN